MRYVALVPLTWGNDTIQPGQDVPAGERGRNYQQMLSLGQIVVASEPVVSTEPTGQIDSRIVDAGNSWFTLQDAEGNELFNGKKFRLKDAKTALEDMDDAAAVAALLNQDTDPGSENGDPGAQNDQSGENNAQSSGNTEPPE